MVIFVCKKLTLTHKKFYSIYLHDRNIEKDVSTADHNKIYLKTEPYKSSQKNPVCSRQNRQTYWQFGMLQ